MSKKQSKRQSMDKTRGYTISVLNDFFYVRENKQNNNF